MTYFHIRTYTIIGAKSFHCPVRDGKEWDQLAMVVRHNRGQKTEDRGQIKPPSIVSLLSQFGRSKKTG